MELLDATQRNNGSATEITLTSTQVFQVSGTNFIQVGTEEISYTGLSGNNLTGIQEQLEDQQQLHI